MKTEKQTEVRTETRIRTTSMDRATHPAFTNKGAVTPRNYDAGAFTSEDRMHAYTRAAMRQGKTVGDILHECLAHRRKMELLGL